MEVSPRALCALEEVKLAAGIDVDDLEPDEQLVMQLNASSLELHRQARREFVALNAGASPPPDAQTRIFDLSERGYDLRELRLGDLTSIASLGVRVEPGSSLVSVVGANYTPLPRVREPWEPIRHIRFHTSVDLAPGYLVEVNGVWGFPAVPDDIRLAAANHAAGSWLLDNGRRSDMAAQGAERADASTTPRGMIDRALKVAHSYRDKQALVSVPVG